MLWFYLCLRGSSFCLYFCMETDTLMLNRFWYIILQICAWGWISLSILGKILRLRQWCGCRWFQETGILVQLIIVPFSKSTTLFDLSGSCWKIYLLSLVDAVFVYSLTNYGRVCKNHMVVCGKTWIHGMRHGIFHLFVYLYSIYISFCGSLIKFFFHTNKINCSSFLLN